VSEPKFTGIWIPAIVLTYPISITAKVCFGVVDGLDNEDGCFASNAYLQNHLQLEKRQLQNILKELDDAKLIVRQEVAGRRIIRTVTKVALVKARTDAQVTRSEGCNPLHGGVQNNARGGCNKLHPYSKDDNKEDKDTKDSAPWSSPLPFESEEFSNAWMSWIAYRKEIKKPIKETTMKAQWKEFALWGEQKSIISIEMSIKNGWQGLFEPARSQGGKGNTKPLTASDHEAF